MRACLFLFAYKTLVSSLFVQLLSLACEPLNLLFFFSKIPLKVFDVCRTLYWIHQPSYMISGFLLSLFLTLLYVFFIFCCFVQVICKVRTYFLCLVNILSWDKIAKLGTSIILSDNFIIFQNGLSMSAGLILQLKAYKRRSA